MTDAEKIAAVTAKLVGGAYRVVPLGSGYLDRAWVIGPDGQHFRDANENRIQFTLVDADKIVRLYNAAAHDA